MDDSDNILGISAIVGEEGTCKTTMALTYPKKLFHFDIDVGGFKRARWRIPDETRVCTLSAHQPISDIDLNDFDIISKPYPKPIQMSKLMGLEVTKATTRMEVKFPRKVEGMKELWQEIVKDFVELCQVPEISSMVLDSATMFWNIDHKSYLQELQERQVYKWLQEHKNLKTDDFPENDYRERLQPLEYGEPNDRMNQLFHTARSFNKNLVLTHYPTDVYGPMPDGKGGIAEGKTGELTLDGYKHTAKLVDLVVWTKLKTQTVPSDPKNPQSKPHEEKYAVAKFAKCGIEGMGISVVGQEVMADFDSIINLRNMMRGTSK